VKIINVKKFALPSDGSILIWIKKLQELKNYIEVSERKDKKIELVLLKFGNSYIYLESNVVFIYGSFTPLLETEEKETQDYIS